MLYHVGGKVQALLEDSRRHFTFFRRGKMIHHLKTDPGGPSQHFFAGRRILFDFGANGLSQLSYWFRRQQYAMT